MASLAELSLYIHIPFCVQRCSYCDFYSVSGAAGELVFRTLDTLLRSVDHELEKLKPGRISTVFIGGGTPSHVPPEMLSSFLYDLWRRIGDPDEYSIEVNPESLSREFLDLVADCGINRISIGVQTYNNTLLHWLGRPAGIEAVERADELLAAHWGGRLSRDLLAALPRNKGGLRADLESALKDDPGHLSLYELIVENGTPLATNTAKLNSLPSENRALEEWKDAVEYLEVSGYRRYEVSNFARPGDECLHNLTYWKMKPSLGIGPSAASTLVSSDGKIFRREEARDLIRWLESPFGSAEELILSAGELALEFFMMGLRTSEGLSRADFFAVFGVDALGLVGGAAEKWCKSGHLLITENAVAPSARGLDFVDSILKDIAVELDNSDFGTASDAVYGFSSNPVHLDR